MTAIDVEALSARRDLQGRPMRGIRKEIYRQTRQFCEDFEEKHLNPAIDSFLKEFNRHINIQGHDGEPAPAGVTIYSFFPLSDVIDPSDSILDWALLFKFWTVLFD